MKKKASLKDIASHLGVSTTLVSYVVNNKEKEARVGPEMVRKIRQAASELNYQPNLLAKGLKSGKTNTIGLIVADISNPFFSNIARIIEDEASGHGYAAIFGSNDESAEKSEGLIKVFLNRQVDGFIIAGAEHSAEQIRALQKNNIPVVLIDRYFPALKTDRVHIDNYQAAYRAVEHLIRRGRTRVGMIAYDMRLPHMQQRINGYKAALKAYGLPFRNTWLRRVTHRRVESDVAEGMKALAQPVLQVDAVLFATNTLAVESLKIIRRSGIKVPEQLAVIAFDESEAFEFFDPAVTCVRQSIEDMGKEAVRLIIDRIEHPGKRPVHIEVGARLVVRGSSGVRRPESPAGPAKRKNKTIDP